MPRPDRLTASLCAALPLTFAGCVLDLSHLSDGPSTGGAGTTSSAGAGGTGGATTGPETTSTPSTTTSATGGAGGSGTTGGAGGATTGTGGGPTCSPLSCGACEEPCPAEGCPPTVIANGPDVVSAPRGVTFTAGALYWVNETVNAGPGAVMRLLDDGTPATAIATGVDQPRTIAAGADLVVWSAKDGVWSCPPAACDANKKKLAPSMATNSIREVAYDGAQVFWADRGTTQDAQDGKVLRCNPANCQPTAIATSQWAPTGLALLDDGLLWTNQASQYEDGRVMKGPKTAAGSEELTAGLLRPTGIAADALRVYWTEYNATGKIRRCPHTTGYCGSPTNVAPALGPLTYPRDVALAGGRVYFSTTDTDGSIRSCPTPGCAAAELPKLHTTGRPDLHRMAIGGTCVFFTDESTGGSVVKVGR